MATDGVNELAAARPLLAATVQLLVAPSQRSAAGGGPQAAATDGGKGLAAARPLHAATVRLLVAPSQRSAAAADGGLAVDGEPPAEIHRSSRR